MATQPNQPQGIGGVLDTALLLYKSSFASVWPISVLLAIVNVAPLVYWLIFERPTFDPTSLGGNPFAIYADQPVTLLISVIFGVLSLWVAGALLLKQRAIGVGEELSAGSAFQISLNRLMPLLGATLLFGLAVGLGLLLLFVPGLILLVSLILYSNLLLFEHKGPVESLQGSRKLVSGNWWRSCGVLAVLGILMFVIVFALSFVAALVIPFAGLALADAFTMAMIAQAITNLAFYVFLWPFATAGLIALYWDLKLRKEGGDLVARVNALSAA